MMANVVRTYVLAVLTWVLATWTHASALPAATPCNGKDLAPATLVGFSGSDVTATIKALDKVKAQRRVRDHCHLQGQASQVKAGRVHFPVAEELDPALAASPILCVTQNPCTSNSGNHPQTWS
ncbi:hypothetical protein [Rhodanobacter sp. B05]|uniref:hypothetical protein n=1 Tax=Rhodanobacter sp. B05 TaxID=1945859 RepID=UPI0011159190|nr:hypothetical protein [Rhodanobacter sp. B05]